MTRQEAIAYNDFLKKELEQIAPQYALEARYGTYIIDHHITVLPEDARKGMIFLGKDSVSYKAGNVRLDLKNALMAGLELMISVNMPESIFNYIQLLIASVFFIKKVTKQSLSRREAYVVYWLHMKNAYCVGWEEERLIYELLEWLQEKEETALSQSDVMKVLKRLYDIKIIDYEEGKAYLQEKVWGEVKL